MDDTQRKSLRLLEMHRLFNQGRSYSVHELQTYFLVTGRTIQRDLLDLQAVPYSLPLLNEGRRWRLDRTHAVPLPPITLTWEQATTLYIAARLLMQHSGPLAVLAAGTVQRLAEALPAEWYGYLTRTILPINPDLPPTPQQSVFTTLVQGWIGRRKVRCQHTTLKGRAHEYTLAPYMFEPSAVGHAIYVRGQCDEDPLGDLRTLKLDRIQVAELTEIPFAPPATDPLTTLQAAWRIWDSDDPPVEIRLRFNATVAARVRETVWHPSQQITDLPGGGCEWQALVAEPQEMLPWIRGWGAACEVVAPRRLRNMLVREARELAHLYNLTAISSPESGLDSTSGSSSDPAATRQADLAQTFSTLFGGSDER